MSDFKFISFVVFLFIVFGAFMGVYTTSQAEYVGIQTNLSNSTETVDVSDYGGIADMADFETNSKYGAMFLAGLGVLMVVVIIRLVRGQ